MRDGGGGGDLPRGGGSCPVHLWDSYQSATVDIADAISTLAFLFSGGRGPGCLDVLDANNDGQLNVADAVTTLSYLLSDGAPIPAPFPDIGHDPSPNALACAMECTSLSELGALTSLGTQVVSITNAPQTWSLSIFGIGLVDVTFNQNDSISVTLGQLDYDPIDAELSLPGSSVSTAGSLFVDGPLGLDWFCFATNLVSISGSIDLEQQQLAPSIILIAGVAVPSSATVNATLLLLSIAACGTPGDVFDLVYPLISDSVNKMVENQVESAVESVLASEVAAQADWLVDASGPIGGIPICVP